jgi:hypothetical protein
MLSEAECEAFIEETEYEGYDLGVGRGQEPVGLNERFPLLSLRSGRPFPGASTYCGPI